jgi:hypothetical protein
MYRRTFFILLILFQVSFLFAEEQTPELKIDLPLFDLPYQIDAMNTVGHGFFSSYANPSMNQSLGLTTGIFSSFHYGMKKFNDNANMNKTLKKVISISTIVICDTLMTNMPGGLGWLHEEYHRAILTRHEINSFNEMNLFPLGKELISNNNILDEDLIRMKNESPFDLIRAHVAGIEGESLLIRNLQRNNFFYNQNLFNEYLYGLSTVSTHLYIYMATLPDTVDTIEKTNNIETTMAQRDFTGFDFTSWVYDLFRPLEPYEARGIYPSGVGINRYRSTQDLTNEELKYLKQQVYLQFFNYISPMMIGIRTISIGDQGLEGNFAFRHNLTSFGSDVSAQIYFKKQPYKMIFTLHNYLNYQNYFPAIEAELIDYPYNIGNFGMFLSPCILIGIQPKYQEFKTNEIDFLGLLKIRIDFLVSRHFLPYMDIVLKTKGWVIGNEYLNENISFRLGISARF